MREIRCMPPKQPPTEQEMDESQPRQTGLLDSKAKIMAFLGVKDLMLAKFVSDGMPVLIIDGRWIAHIDNLEDFFRKYTRVDSRSKVSEIPCQEKNE